MREIKYIVLHCAATPQTATIEAIQKYWRTVLKWKDPGYHFLIRADGTYQNLQPIEKVSNGVQGFNQNSIHISYIGGVDANNKPIDNRTPAQIETQLMLLKMLVAKFPSAIIKGHRDFPNVKKACPSFDVATWLKSIGYDPTRNDPFGAVVNPTAPQAKINGWVWFTDTKETFGIVIFTDLFGIRKAFIGNLAGNDNVFEDIQYIVDRGAKFSLAAAEIAVKETGTTKEMNYNDLMP